MDLAADRCARFELSSFPRGWFAIAEASELLPGKTLPVHAFGRDFVAFRGDDGVARVFDAFCPHLGAHLGHGGCVRGNTVRCPYHGWSFDGRGECVEIPYARKIPPGARVAVHEVRERAGLVMLWHDPAGGPPDFELPEPSIVTTSDGVAWIRQPMCTFEIRGHVQDLAENAVDAAHFITVHELEEAPRMAPEAAGPLFHVRNTIRYPKRLGAAEGTLDTTSCGLGFNTAHFRGLIETQLVSTVTPLEVDKLVMRVVPFVRDLGEPMAVATIAAFFLTEVLRQIEADIRIWEHKRLLLRPVLCDADGPISVFRRWSRQFFRELGPVEA